jgi:hypothetical protein
MPEPQQMPSKRFRAAPTLAAASLLCCLGSVAVPAQQPDGASIIQKVDAAVKARVDSIVGYTDTEHYSVYRNHDEVHPVAEMTVKTTYRQDSGKSYAILSQSGSQIIRNMVLGSILDNEKQINLPGTREGSWITSANYVMKLQAGGTQPMNGRDCYLLRLIPKRKAPYLVDGTLWVDARDGAIVQLVGFASKSASFLTGPTQMMRQYTNIYGFAEATQARAVSNSFLFGQTVVTIDYRDYQIQLRPTQ